MNTDENRLAGVLRRLIGRAEGQASRKNCPDEETLACYLGGTMETVAKQQLESHLATCSLCVEEVVAAYEAGRGYNTDRVPQQLVDRAMSLVKGESALFDVVIRLVKDSIELVSTSGRLTSPLIPAAVRGELKPSQGDVLQVEKDLGRFNVAVELNVLQPRTCQLVAHVTHGGRPAEGVRLNLISGDREQSSFLTRSGEVSFDGVPPGEYKIELFDSGSPVGTIRLKLEQDAVKQRE